MLGSLILPLQVVQVYNKDDAFQLLYSGIRGATILAMNDPAFAAIQSNQILIQARIITKKGMLFRITFAEFSPSILCISSSNNNNNKIDQEDHLLNFSMRNKVIQSIQNQSKVAHAHHGSAFTYLINESVMRVSKIIISTYIYIQYI